MKLAPEVENALGCCVLEQDITREEALAVIARDWLIGQRYLPAEWVLPADEDDEEGQSAQT